MSFTVSRRLQKLLLPLALLLLLCGFGVANLLLAAAYPWGAYFAGLAGPAGDVGAALRDSGLAGVAAMTADAHGLLGWAMLGAFALTGLLGLRRLWVHRLYLLLAVLQALLLLPMAYLYLRLPAVVTSIPALSKPGHAAYMTPSLQAAWRYEFSVSHAGVFPPILAGLAGWFLLLGLRATRNLYARRLDSSPDWADRLLENLRSHGRAPDFRRGVYVSIALHLLLLMGLPAFFSLGGCAERYDIPPIASAGEPPPPSAPYVKSQLQVVVLNPNSRFIIFDQPPVEDIGKDHIDDLNQKTQLPDPPGDLRGAGEGSAGSGAGSGLTDAIHSLGRLRFIRLQVNGGIDWDQNMGEGADYNMLLYMAERLHITIAERTESKTITEVRLFTQGKAPPFVYLTGGLRGSISLSPREREVLRDYLFEEGGMIFADAGGPGFDRAFRAMLRQTMPEYSLVTVSKDDPILMAPHPFADGAPQLWPHSRPPDLQGIKHNGRWVVIYHPGDINDAWKTGHKDADPRVIEQAYKLGANIILYALLQYHRRQQDAPPD